MEHAHWIIDEGWWGVYTCSKCNWWIENDPTGAHRVVNIKEFNYCPHCGAKMDEEEDNEN